MVPFVIFVAGVAVGIGACKLYDVLKSDSETRGAGYIEKQQPKPYGSATQPTDSCNTTASKLDISALESIMRQHGVDISSANCLYILCNQIKSNTYKRLLDDIIGKTKTGEDLISFINNVHIETFTFPDAASPKGCFFIPITTIDQLLTASAIATDSTDPKAKVEMLINAAYASAINRLKKNFGIEFSKLINAYEEGHDVQSYYNDIIKEIKISRDFLMA